MQANKTNFVGFCGLYFFFHKRDVTLHSLNHILTIFFLLQIYHLIGGTYKFNGGFIHLLYGDE